MINKEINLKEGNRFYYVSPSFQIKWMTYLCVHPRNSRYHILIGMNEDPLRMYDEHLFNLVKESTSSYEEAKNVLVEKLKFRIISIQARIDEETKIGDKDGN